MLVALLVCGTCVGLVLVFMIAVVEHEVAFPRRARRTLYALTDRRALIWSPAERLGTVAVQQFFPGTIRADRIERVEYSDGSGDLNFQPPPGEYRQDGLYAVADIRRVDELVRRVLVDPASWPKSPAISELADFEEPF